MNVLNRPVKEGDSRSVHYDDCAWLEFAGLKRAWKKPIPPQAHSKQISSGTNLAEDSRRANLTLHVVSEMEDRLNAGCSRQ
jgi:hypothetical protein